jgi:hypothetical protein
MALDAHSTGKEAQPEAQGLMIVLRHSRLEVHQQVLFAVV